MSVQSEILAGQSLVALASIYNAAVENHSLPVKPVAKFASKGMGIAKISNIVGTYGLELVVVNDVPSLIQIETPEAPEGDESEDDEPAEEPAAFVRLPKDQLPARGTPERAAYRRARRAAARAARKSSVAA